MDSDLRSAAGGLIGMALCALVTVAFLWVLLGGVRIVNQVERGVVFRFGRARSRVRQPGLTVIVPLIDRLRRVNVQIVTMPIPSQEGITRDNVSVKVDAVVYFRVSDPYKAAIEVQNYTVAVELLAQTSLRSVIGKSELDELLSNRDELHQELRTLLEAPTHSWGMHIDRVEIKDVQLPEQMKRAMSKQAEAERERRARIITADGEYRAAQSLADASTIMAETPGAMQLRLLHTVVEVAAEKNSTLVMPFPVELLRFFDRVRQSDADAEAGRAGREPPQPPPEIPHSRPASE